MKKIQKTLASYLSKTFFINPQAVVKNKFFVKDFDLNQYEIFEVIAHLENTFGLDLPEHINTKELSVGQLYSMAHQQIAR